MALRDRPIIKAARERLAENHPVAAAVAGAVADGLREAQADPASSVERVDAPTVEAVAMAVAPIVQNAQNQEPWWKSRIWVGIITAIFGAILARLNIQFTANEQALVNQVTPYVPQALGLAIAAIGRAVGNRQGPIIWRRPWTLFGIGR